jgi:hypothetical protein
MTCLDSLYPGIKEEHHHTDKHKHIEHNNVFKAGDLPDTNHSNYKPY